MFSTPITRAFGLATPIVNAGMAMVARPPLAAEIVRRMTDEARSVLERLAVRREVA